MLNVNPKQPDAGIVGKHFRPANSCRAYKCKNSSDGNCDDFDAICVDIKKGMVQDTDYFIVESPFSMDGKSIDVDIDWDALGYPNGQVGIINTTSRTTTSYINK